MVVTMPGSRSRRGGGVTRDDDDAADAVEQVDRSVISVPLLERMRGAAPGDAAEADPWHHIVVDLNYAFPGGVDAAARKVRWMLATFTARAGSETDPAAAAAVRHTRGSQFLYALVPSRVIEAVTALDRQPPDAALWSELAAAGPFSIDRRHFDHRAIHRIWPDFETRPLRHA
jgi:serine protease AprX